MMKKFRSATVQKQSVSTGTKHCRLKFNISLSHTLYMYDYVGATFGFIVKADSNKHEVVVLVT